MSNCFLQYVQFLPYPLNKRDNKTLICINRGLFGEIKESDEPKNEDNNNNQINNNNNYNDQNNNIYNNSSIF